MIPNPLKFFLDEMVASFLSPQSDDEEAVGYYDNAGGEDLEALANEDAKRNRK